jgi:hypothetical protein
LVEILRGLRGFSLFLENYHGTIHHLASKEGASPIHLVQPSPFMTNSKVLRPEEQHLIANAYRIDDCVVKGYPKLQRKMSDLCVQDAVFVSVQTSTWTDPVHANNEERLRMIMDRIAELIRANKNLISSLHNPKMQR